VPGRLVPQALQKRPLRVLPLMAPVQIHRLDGCCRLAAETLKGCLKGEDCVHIRQLQTVTAGLPFSLAIPAAVAQRGCDIACAICRGNCKSCWGQTVMTALMMLLNVHADAACLLISPNIHRLDDAFAGAWQHADAPCLLSIGKDPLLLGLCCMKHCRHAGRRQADSKQTIGRQ